MGENCGVMPNGSTMRSREIIMQCKEYILQAQGDALTYMLAELKWISMLSGYPCYLDI